MAGVASYQAYQVKKRGRRLFDDPGLGERTATPPTEPLQPQPPSAQGTDSNPPRVSSPIHKETRIDTNRVHSPLPRDPKEPRIPSASLSISMVEQMDPSNKIANAPFMPTVELIQFD